MQLPRWMFDEVRRIFGAVRSTPGTVSVAVKFTVNIPEERLNRPDLVVQLIRDFTNKILDEKCGEINELISSNSKQEYAIKKLPRFENGEKRTV